MACVRGDPKAESPGLSYCTTLFPEFPHLTQMGGYSQDYEMNSLQTMANITSSKEGDTVQDSFLGSEEMSSGSHQKYVFNIICPIQCSNILVGLVSTDKLPKTGTPDKKDTILQKF